MFLNGDSVKNLTKKMTNQNVFNKILSYGCSSRACVCFLQALRIQSNNMLEVSKLPLGLCVIDCL